MRALPVLMSLSIFVTACGSRDKDATATATASSGGKTISGINIDTDGFKADVAIPGMTFGGDKLDMDGMKLYPGSTVRGVRVKATDKDGAKDGSVTIDFTSPAAPATVSDHLARAAETAGFTVSGVSPTGLTGTKREDGEDNRFTFALAPAGAATTGQLTMTGRGHDGR